MCLVSRLGTSLVNVVNLIVIPIPFSFSFELMKVSEILPISDFSSMPVGFFDIKYQHFDFMFIFENGDFQPKSPPASISEIDHDLG